MTRLASCVGCLVLTLGCHHAAPSQDDLLHGAEEATRSFFAVAEQGDCAQIKPLMTHPEACEGMVKEFAETHSHLSSIDTVKVDGRDPQLVLVTVTAQATKRVHTWIVRVKQTPDGWRVAL